MEKINFVAYSPEFLDLSWDWLNDPEIKALTSTPDFTREQQQRWYETLPQKKDYFVWGIRWDHQPIGVLGLKNIENQEGEYFGYIGVKEFWSKGLSKPMLDFIKDNALKIGLKTIYLKVAPANTRAIRAYEKNGFIHAGEKDSLVLMTFSLNND